jgi:hypothetical protein
MNRIVATVCGAVVVLLTVLPYPAAAGGPCFGIPSMLFLENYPLANTEVAHVVFGYQNNVDPRLLLALAQTESTFGTLGPTCPARHNAWGWGGAPPKCWDMGTWANGVATVALHLRTDYLNKGYNTLSAIKYPYCCGSCTGGAAQCGTGQCHPECNNWLSHMTDFYRKYHGDLTNLNYSWSCCGDCDNEGQVYVNDLLWELDTRFGGPDTCLRGDVDGQPGMTVDEILYALADALSSCVAP